MTMVRNAIEVSNSNASGLMNPWKNAKRCPARPAMPALMPKAIVFTACVLSPIDSAAIGLSRRKRGSPRRAEQVADKQNRANEGRDDQHELAVEPPRIP